MQIKIAPFLFIDETEGKGRGVFTKEKIPPRKIVEISSVLILDESAKQLLDQTALHDYIFDWGVKDGFCCVAWGYVSLYNHSYSGNCEYFMDYENNVIMIKAVRTILPGEELTINYNGDWNNEKPLWFQAI